MVHGIHRRRLLVASGGLAGTLASFCAPAYAQGATMGTTIYRLRWNDFVPAPDQLLRREIAQGCQRALGIRPEDPRIASDGDADGLSFEAIAEVVEQFVSEILLDVRVGADMMAAAVESTARARLRDRLRLAMNPDRLHFFDAQTEEAV